MTRFPPCSPHKKNCIHSIITLNCYCKNGQLISHTKWHEIALVTLWDFIPRFWIWVLLQEFQGCMSVAYLKIQCVGLGSFSLAAAPALLLCRFIFHWCIKWSREDMTLSNGHMKANYFHISSCNIYARHCFFPVLRWLLFLFSRPLWIIHHCLFQLSSALPKLVFCHNEGTAPSFLLPANPFPPQLQFHNNSCTFSISCKLRYEPQIHCVCYSHNDAKISLVQLWSDYLRQTDTAPIFALRLFATPCLSVTNKNYSRIH